jgi:hypothetical protein
MGFVNPIKRNIPQISIEPVKTLYYTNNIAGVSESDLKIAGVINAPQKINKQVSFPSWTEITGVSVSNGDYTTPVYIYVLNNNLRRSFQCFKWAGLWTKLDRGIVPIKSL